MCPSREDLSRPVRGPLLCVTWITIVTVCVAFFSSDPFTENLLRPLYFGGLLVFFVGLGQRVPSLRTPPYRMIEMGFLLLFAGSALAALLRRATPNLFTPELAGELAFVLDRGIAFLLGLSLIAYGIVLWVPEILESQRVLKEHLAEEEARNQKAQALIARQEALVTVGELAAGVAHELRNPLAIVKSALQTIREEDLQQEEHDRYLEVMERAVAKANQRIGGLLDLGKAHPFTPSVLNARPFLKESLDLVRPEARSAGLELELGAVGHEDAIYADRQLLMQVLVNLLRNAIQAGPHSAPLCLRYEAMPHGASRILVVDRGRGFPEEIREMLFSPFFTTKPEGVGMGLSISTQLIDKHGGKLWLSQAEDGGTCASIELPGPPVPAQADSLV
ncbi:MAG: sensor histidine kinase [Planctomycetota bacterium]